ncbi:MAG: CC/Se motif family (seleno)protein [Negativicutes bacterium]|nr:CC/Se motif family (seleno)protein [Negativicutes bacterium]
MLSLTSEAVAYIQSRNKSIFLDIPPLINCDITMQESPTISFGQPRNPENYNLESIQGVSVYVPHNLPKQLLTITLVKFFRWRKLVVEGWHLA